MKLKRIAALLLALVMISMLSTALFACSKGSPTVMELGEYEVSYNMLRYFVRNYMGDATAADLAADETLQKELEDNVYAALRSLAACRAVADEHEIELTDDEMDNLDSQIETMKAGYESEDAYNAEIEAQFGDEETFREIMVLTLLQDKLFSYLTDEYHGVFKSDDPTVRADVEAGNFFAAEYLYLYCTDEDRAEKKAFAESLHSRIADGEAMAEIDKEYQTEFGVKMDYCALPCFTYTEELQYFEDAVLALSVGELGAIIERDDGFLIVKRLELDQSYIDKNFMSVVDSYIGREYTRYMQDRADELELEWSSDYEDLKLWEIE